MKKYQGTHEANSSGGGISAGARLLAFYFYANQVMGLVFKVIRAVSGSSHIALLISALGYKETLKFVYKHMNTVWKHRLLEFLWSWLPWKKPVKSFTEYGLLRKSMQKALKGKTFNIEVVIQCYDLYSQKSVYFSTKNHSVNQMIEFSLAGAAPPGLAPLLEYNGMLLGDTGVFKNNIAVDTMDKNSTIWNVSIHGKQAGRLTPKQYKEMDAFDLLGVTISATATDVYQNDKKEIIANYPKVEFIEAEEPLEVFKYSKKAFDKAYQECLRIMKRDYPA